MKSCNKIREAYGLKILVNEETYNEYKGTYEEQIEELQERIDKAIEYIWFTKYEWGDLEEDNEDFDIDIYKLLDILKGDK